MDLERNIRKLMEEHPSREHDALVSAAMEALFREDSKLRELRRKA